MTHLERYLHLETTFLIISLSFTELLLHYGQLDSFNDLTILTRKTVFYSIQYKINRSLAASDLFPTFPQIINFYTFYFHILKSKMLEKRDSSNRQKWIVASFSISARFTAKFELAFVLTQKNASSQRFHFKANRMSISSSN